MSAAHNGRVSTVFGDIVPRANGSVGATLPIQVHKTNLPLLFIATDLYTGDSPTPGAQLFVERHLERDPTLIVCD